MTEKIKVAYIVIIILAALTFFQLAAIGESGFKILEMIGIILIAVVFILHFVYDSNPRFPHHFRFEIFLIFFGVLLSMIAAFIWHSQDVMITAIAQRAMYFYLFYFTIHQTRIRPENLEKIILVIATAYTICFIVQFVAYPSVIFESRIDNDRSTLRIFLPGLPFLLLGYFFSFNKVLGEQKYLYLLLMVPYFVIFILMGTRQVLFTVIFVTFINLIFSGTLQSKLVIGALGLLSLIPLYFAFQDIFSELIALTQKQTQDYDEDIRLQAARFFMGEFMPDRWAYVTGNGMHSYNSPYGVEVEGFKRHLGYYQSDIGIIGAYSRYGLFFLAGVFGIIARVLLLKLSRELLYIKAYFLFVAFTLLIAGNQFIGPPSIVAVIICLYLVDLNLYDREYSLKKTT